MVSPHTLPRLFVAPDTLDGAAGVGSTGPMTPGQARYLGTVLRRGEGDEVRLFNGVAGEWRAKISGLRKDRGSWNLLDRLRAPCGREGEAGATLAFALLKRDATDLVIRMGTELGVTRFIPLVTDRTVGQRVNGDRLDAIATEAAEQCERLTVPVVEEPVRLMDFLGHWPATRRVFAAVERIDERTNPEDRDRPDDAAGLGDAQVGDAILVGPEGGFSDMELDVLLARPFVSSLTLGHRVLRAETAVAAALSLFDARLRTL